MESTNRNFPSEHTGISPQQKEGDSFQDASLEAINRGRRLAAHHVSERPLSVLALGFVAGAGAGTLIGSLLFDQFVQRQTSTSSLLQRISDTVSDAVTQAKAQTFK